MKGGVISEQGSYRQLLRNKGDFAEFLIQFLSQDSEEAIDNEDLTVIEEMVAAVKPELERRISKKSNSFSESGSVKDLLKRTLSKISIASKASDKKTKTLEMPAKNQNKLIEAETTETGSVKLAIYLDYAKAVGFIGVGISLICFATSQGFNLGGSLWLTAWSNDALDISKRNDTNLRDLRLGVYGGLGALEASFQWIGTLCIYLTALKGSKIIHNEMLEHIIQAPMSFFDTTPLGRILNR